VKHTSPNLEERAPSLPAGSPESLERILVVRLSALGDILHTLPAVQALRESFPGALLDWVVDAKWAPILRGSPSVDHVLPLNRKSWDSLWSRVRGLRAASYSCAVDLQGLYKSAVLAALSGAPRRVGFDSGAARERGAAIFYTEHVAPSGRHVAEHNLAIAAHLGARKPEKLFPLPICADADSEIEYELKRRDLREFYTFAPGGSWRAKCWPPERFGELCRELERTRGWRGVMVLGPSERELGAAVIRSAAPAVPVTFPTDLLELMALLRRARFLVGVDSGPLHLAVALGTPVVGLYGPTDPARNGPFSTEDVVVRNARPEETSYKRREEYSPTMLSISVPQVIAAIEERLARLSFPQGVGAREGN
jgi:heptosyltransferase-1